MVISLDVQDVGAKQAVRVIDEVGLRSGRVVWSPSRPGWSNICLAV
jgi:hypothetical protein